MPARLGTGPVDTFNSAKVLFNFPMHRLPPGTARRLGLSLDLEPGRRMRMKRDDGERMELHWDGNNTHTEERNKSAAFGTGTTPPTLDLKAVARVEEWLLTASPPAGHGPWMKPSRRGKALYGEYCAAATAPAARTLPASGSAMSPRSRRSPPTARLDSYTYDLAVNQATLYAGYPHRFTHFRKTFGYANMPLDGIWLRAPYLHNGSVPTCATCSNPPPTSAQFYRGDDVLDQTCGVRRQRRRADGQASCSTTPAAGQRQPGP